MEILLNIDSNNVGLLSSRVSAATSPEEAARIFRKEITKVLALAMAEALKNTLDQLSTSVQSNSAIVGWPQFVVDGGLCMDLHWPSSNLTTLSNLPAYFAQVDTSPSVNLSTQGITGSFTVTIGGSY